MADDVDFVLFSHEVAQLPENVGLCTVLWKKVSHRVELWVARGNVLQARYTHLLNKNPYNPNHHPQVVKPLKMSLTRYTCYQAQAKVHRAHCRYLQSPVLRFAAPAIASSLVRRKCSNHKWNPKHPARKPEQPRPYPPSTFASQYLHKDNHPRRS